MDFLPEFAWQWVIASLAPAFQINGVVHSSCCNLLSATAGSKSSSDRKMLGLAREKLLIALEKGGWCQPPALPREHLNLGDSLGNPPGKALLLPGFLGWFGGAEVGVVSGCRRQMQAGFRAGLDGIWSSLDWWKVSLAGMSLKLHSKPFYGSSTIPGCGFLSQPNSQGDQEF